MSRFTGRDAWAIYFTRFLNVSECGLVTSNFLCLDQQARNVLPLAPFQNQGLKSMKSNSIESGETVVVVPQAAQVKFV